VAFTALGAILAGLLGCTDGGPDAADAEPAAEAQPPADRPIADRRPFGNGFLSATLVDSSRPTPAVPDQGIAAAEHRTIGLTIVYPVESDGEPSGRVGTAGIVDGTSPPDDTDTPPAAGPFPLLVFAHGWNGSGASLIGPAARWARAGYVVALPTFPLSQEGIATDVDMVNQPGDVSFVIDTLLARSDDPDDRLAGVVDPDRVAVGGHSLGSATVFGFHNSCCHDDRVKAIVAISGGPAPYSTGTYDAAYTTPMLLVHGVRDPGVPVAISEAMFEHPGRMGLLLFDEGDHTSIFGGPDGQLLDQVMVPWLDSELGLDPAATEGLEQEVAATGRGSLRSKDA
jgi:dienelactone hydrolase